MTAGNKSFGYAVLYTMYIQQYTSILTSCKSRSRTSASQNQTQQRQRIPVCTCTIDQHHNHTVYYISSTKIHPHSNIQTHLPKICDSINNIDSYEYATYILLTNLPNHNQYALQFDDDCTYRIQINIPYYPP